METVQVCACLSAWLCDVGLLSGTSGPLSAGSCLLLTHPPVCSVWPPAHLEVCQPSARRD